MFVGVCDVKKFKITYWIVKLRFGIVFLVSQKEFRAVVIELTQLGKLVARQRMVEIKPYPIWFEMQRNSITHLI